MPVEVRIIADECIGCGACATVCSAGAITFDDDEMKASVDRDECVGCEDCIPLCAVDAIVPEEVGDGTVDRVARPASTPPARESTRPRPEHTSEPHNGTPVTPETFAGRGAIRGEGGDAPAGGWQASDDEHFRLREWRPGRGSLRRALRRRLGGRDGH